ncbi:hypothetical protein LINGRAPRIM_LOCUS2319 [Linum grandiflorum]
MLNPPSSINKDGHHEGNLNAQVPNKFTDDKKIEDCNLENKKKNDDNNGSMHEDSTNPYDKYNNIFGTMNANLSPDKGNVMDISDDASSSRKMTETNKDKKTKKMHGLEARKEIVNWLLLHQDNKQKSNNILGAHSISTTGPEYRQEQLRAIRELKALTKQSQARVNNIKFQHFE